MYYYHEIPSFRKLFNIFLKRLFNFYNTIFQSFYDLHFQFFRSFLRPWLGCKTTRILLIECTYTLASFIDFLQYRHKFDMRIVDLKSLEKHSNSLDLERLCEHARNMMSSLNEWNEIPESEGEDIGREMKSRNHNAQTWCIWKRSKKRDILVILPNPPLRDFSSHKSGEEICVRSIRIYIRGSGPSRYACDTTLYFFEHGFVYLWSGLCFDVSGIPVGEGRSSEDN